ncbi:MAG: LuxR C-terminal-related transcriptional regulator [Lapillicoccus sp.]
MVHSDTAQRARKLLPAGPSGEATFGDLEGPSWTALLVAVLAEECDQWALVQATSVVLGRKCDVDVLDPVVARGLASVDVSRVCVRSDDVRQGVTARALPSERQRVHRALAVILDDDPIASAWHWTHSARTAAAEAAELALTTARSLQRAGRPARARTMLEQAARLSPTAAMRAACLLEAGATLFALGLPRVASDLVGLAEMTGLDPDLETLAEILRVAFADPHPQGPRIGCAEGERAARTVNGWGLTSLSFSILVAVGGSPESLTMRAGSAPGTAALEALRALGTGDQHEAARLLAHDCRSLARAGLRGVETHVRALLAQTAARIGDLETSTGEALAARELALATEQPAWATHAALTEATVASMRGLDAGRPSVEDVERAVLIGVSPLRPLADLARAVARLSADEARDAYPVLVRLLTQTESCPELLTAGLLGYVAEAALHTGKVVECRSLISRIAVVSPACTRGAELADLLYATAILAPDASAETCFDAVQSLESAQWPWIHARTDFARGAWLRRNRRVCEARQHLLSAQRLFAALDAPVWQRRVQNELRAAGVRATTPATSGTNVEVAGRLSPQELAIAQLAAEGLSNRQIGDRLFLSPRTVGSHLYRIFPKLDVTSRRQLMGLVSMAS